MGDPKLKVLYESSVLRLAEYHETSKTGIYRVVDELFKQLLTHEDLMIYSFIIEFLEKDPDFLLGMYNLNPEQLIRSQHVWNTDNILKRTFYKPLYNSRERVKERNSSNILNTIQRKSLSFLIDSINGNNKVKKFFLDTKQYDICHFLTYCVNKNMKKMKTLYTIYDLIPMKFPNLLSSDLERKNYIRSMNNVNDNTWITCISESTRNDLLYYFPHLNPDKISVNYISVSENIKRVTDTGILKKVLNKFKLDMDSDYLISVSTIEPRKNMITVLKAFKILISNANYKHLKLVLVGPQGWKFDELNKEITSNSQLEKQVIFTGFVSDAELASLYTKARLFLYISLYEGFGIPPLEAMRCGTPVITSNCSSLPEVVGDGGIMVDPLDVEEVVHSVKKILEDDAFTKDLLKRAEKRVQNFSWKKYGNEINALYKKIHNS